MIQPTDDGYISNYLIHWTGKNNDASGAEVLSIIGRTCQLLLNYNPIFSYDFNNRIIEKMVCFTDIPLRHSNKHCIKYGRFGIAFDKLKLKDCKLLLTIRKQDLHSKHKKIAEANDNIHLLGYITEKEKIKLISNCEAVLFASDYEAFGTVVLEASNYKKPILCSGLLVFKEILNDSGVIYFNNNLVSIEQAIKNFILLDELPKTEMGNINYNNLNRFTLEKIKEKYSRISRGSYKIG